MSEKEYTVVVNSRDDLPTIEAELTASTGAGPIPSRAVSVANPRPGSKIQTHFMLTDEEAEALRADSRVRAVEIPPDQRDDISIGLVATQASTFRREENYISDNVNWGLRRCIESSNTFNDAVTLDGNYDYALTGKGVDVVIQDSGVDPNHPEWEDENGVSRFQQIDWYLESGLAGVQEAGFYADYDGHGTHCAGISCGKTFGWAKGANIYAQKLNGLEGTLDPNNGISINDAFDCIRLWHNNKTNGRPTVVNMSWGYGATITTNPISGVYRGVPWTWGVDYIDRQALETATGVSIARFVSGFTTFFRMPVRVASVDAEIEDMITDGIHICIAAGNGYNKVDVSTGQDYNNSVLFGASNYEYHRGSSPYSVNAFMVTNMDSATFDDGGTFKDKIARSSTRGPGCNILAPGTDIMATQSSNYDATKYSGATVDYFDDATYNQMAISGTSMASPQVAGVCALHLEALPNLTPAELQQRIFNDSKTGMYTTNSDTDYDNQSNSLLGQSDRILFSKYGVINPLRIQ